jgi:TetR/AcrR family transcriptional repressor of nem operon
VKASFEAGIRVQLELLGRLLGETVSEEPNERAIAILSTMIGALILSRTVNDKRLSKQFLEAAANTVQLVSSSSDAAQ